MTVHHIFSQEHYPHLAMCLDNLITVRKEVHQKFQVWNGGKTKACTVDDLINFVDKFYSDEKQYPNQERLMIHLNQVKKVLRA
jgi:hypothetical protein